MTNEILEIIKNHISDLSLIVFFILIFLNSSMGLPPSELILFACGIAVYQGNFSFVESIVITYLGSILGAFVLFRLSKRYSYLLNKIPLRFKNKVDKIIDYAEKYNWKVIVLVGRFIPGIRTQVSIPAGIYKMQEKKFLLYSSIGLFIWNITWILIGYKCEENWDLLQELIIQYKVLILALIILFMIFKGIKFLKKHYEQIKK